MVGPRLWDDPPRMYYALSGQVDLQVHPSGTSSWLPAIPARDMWTEGERSPVRDLFRRRGPG